MISSHHLGIQGGAAPKSLDISLQKHIEKATIANGSLAGGPADDSLKGTGDLKVIQLGNGDLAIIERTERGIEACGIDRSAGGPGHLVIAAAVKNKSANGLGGKAQDLNDDQFVLIIAGREL